MSSDAVSDVPLPVQIPLVFARHDLAPEKVYPPKNGEAADFRGSYLFTTLDSYASDVNTSPSCVVRGANTNGMLVSPST